MAEPKTEAPHADGKLCEKVAVEFAVGLEGKNPTVTYLNHAYAMAILRESFREIRTAAIGYRHANLTPKD